MGKSKVSHIKDKSGRIIGKDTTRDSKDGSSKTTHQKASFSILGGVSATKTTGVTHNKPNGTSKNYKK